MDLALQVEGVSKLREKNMVMSPTGLGSEIDCAGEDQQQLKTTDPTSRFTTTSLQLSKDN
jgi:hypothetical protein